MKKYLGLLLCLSIMITPALANTVKENNYSEELNTTQVNDYVNKKIHVIEETTDYSDINSVQNRVNGEIKVKADEYIALKERNIATLREKQAYYIKYFDIKIRELTSGMERVRNATNRTEAQKVAILALHQKNINECLDQKSQTVGRLQTEIDKIQAEIDTMRAKQK